MIDDFVLSILTVEQRRVIQIMAEHGLVGGTEEEVAAYLIVRGIDDLMRSGVLKISESPATP